MSYSCSHFHWSYLVSANVPTSEAAVLSGALPSQVHLHITRWNLIIWPTDDQLMITWWSPEDQLMINWYSSDDQLIIILSLIQTPSGLFARNVCRTWKVAWGEVEGEGSQIRGDQYHTSPEAKYHLGWSVVYCHWLRNNQKSKHITFIHGFDCDHNRHHNHHHGDT